MQDTITRFPPVLRDSEQLARDLGGSAGRVTMALDEDLDARRKAALTIAGLIWCYQSAIVAGADKLEVLDLVRGSIDMMANLNGRLRDGLDELGLYNGETIDLSGLEELAARLERETSTRLRLVRR